MLKSDVAQYESITKLSLPGDSSSDETDSIVNLGISQKSTSRRSSNVNFSDLGSKLKNELHRAVLSKYSGPFEYFQRLYNNRNFFNIFYYLFYQFVSKIINF